MIKHAANFRELVDTPFTGGINALCWQRRLSGDFGEIVKLLGPGEGVVALDEARLRRLALSAKGLEAANTMLADLHLLREAGRDPVLNIIYDYPRDDLSALGPATAEDPHLFPRDVLSWHVDSAPVEADTWLCTYHGAPSEGLLNENALRKVDDPVIRALLLALYGGSDDQSFAEWLTENHYDLHFAQRNVRGLPNGYSFGTHNLWRVACAWPESPVLPCVHRAPVTNAPRLLLIS